jgi:hypothetical protein
MLEWIDISYPSRIMMWKWIQSVTFPILHWISSVWWMNCAHIPDTMKKLSFLISTILNQEQPLGGWDTQQRRTSLNNRAWTKNSICFQIQVHLPFSKICIYSKRSIQSSIIYIKLPTVAYNKARTTSRNKWN